MEKVEKMRKGIEGQQWTGEIYAATYSAPKRLAFNKSDSGNNALDYLKTKKRSNKNLRTPAAGKDQDTQNPY